MMQLAPEPTHRQEPTPTTKRSPLLTNRWETATHATVLVVDDNCLNSDLLSRHLVSQGHIAVTAESGDKALSLLREHRFDLVILDVTLTDGRGVDVLAAIQQVPSLHKLPVVMMGTMDEMEELVRCLELGAADYLLKPFKAALLRIRINNLLETQSLKTNALMHREELSTLHDVARDVHASLRMDRVLATMLTRSLTQVNGAAGFIALLNADGAVSIGAQTGYEANPHEAAGTAVSLAQLGLAGMDLSISHWVTTRDFSDPEQTVRPFGLLRDAQSWILVPIRRQLRTLALLVIEDVVIRRYDQGLLDFLNRLAEHAASAIWNAQLYASIRTNAQTQHNNVAEISRELKLTSTAIKEDTSEHTLSALASIRIKANQLYQLADDLDQPLNAQVADTLPSSEVAVSPAGVF